MREDLKEMNRRYTLEKDAPASLEPPGAAYLGDGISVRKSTNNYTSVQVR